MNKITTWGILLSFVLSSMFWMACTKKNKLEPLQRMTPRLYYGNLSARFCSAANMKLYAKLKVIFILDHSDSNSHEYKRTVGGVETIYPPSDPVPANRRYGQMLSYIDKMKALAASKEFDVSFAHFKFNDNSYMLRTASQEPFFSGADIDDFKNKIAAIKSNPVDGGETKYLNVLPYVENLIHCDIQRAYKHKDKSKTIYEVFFLSDGFPSDDYSTDDLKSKLLEQVRRVVQIRGKNQSGGEACGSVMPASDPVTPKQIEESPYVEDIILHTGMYYNPDPLDLNIPPKPLDPEVQTAMDLLVQMSSPTGKGTFTAFSGGVDFQKFMLLEQEQKLMLKDVFVRNSNLVWENNLPKFDSDGDGLSDDLERSLGSNPYDPDSDFNGVSDYIEYNYFVSGQDQRVPCKGLSTSARSCSLTDAIPFNTSTCVDLSPQVDTTTGKIKFPKTMGDPNLNDCERKVIGASLLQLTTNGGWVPDYLLLVNQMNIFSYPTDLFNIRISEPISDYQKIKLGMPAFMNVKKMGDDFKMPDFSLNKITSASDRDPSCYELQANNIAALTISDTLALHVFEGLAAVKDHRKLTLSQKPMSNLEVRFVPSDFK